MKKLLLIPLLAVLGFVGFLLYRWKASGAGDPMAIAAAGAAANLAAIGELHASQPKDTTPDGGAIRKGHTTTAAETAAIAANPFKAAAGPQDPKYDTGLDLGHALSLGSQIFAALPV